LVHISGFSLRILRFNKRILGVRYQSSLAPKILCNARITLY
jgi:hypothetical protein